MRKTKKRMSVLLAVLVAVPALLTPASADPPSPDRTIMMGTSGISDPVEKSGTFSFENPSGEYTLNEGKYKDPSDYIWFGKNNGDPIMWRVLDAWDRHSDCMVLLSEYLTEEELPFYQTGYSAGPTRSDGKNFNAWQGSNAQKWCRDFEDKAFTEKELKDLGSMDQTDASISLYGEFWGEKSSSGEDSGGDRVSFLSAEELSRYMGSSDYGGAPGLMAVLPSNSYPAVWWLRSPSGTRRCGSVYAENVRTDDISMKNHARPAMSLNLDFVLFTSAAEGGKSFGEGFRKVDDYTGNMYGKGEWKLTLLDNTRDFYVRDESVSASVGGTFKLNYTKATTGDNERISAMIFNGDEMLYYGKLKDMANGETEGSLDIRLPGDLPEGTYTLKIFNEQCNGDKLTDYSSAMTDVTLSVTAPPPAPPAPPTPPTPPTPPAPPASRPVVVTPGDEETPEAVADPQEPAAAAGRPAPTRTQDAPSAEPFTVRFDAGGGSGEMESAGAAAGKEYVLPECRFAAPEGKVFDRWDVRAPEDDGGRFFAPGERITVTGSVIIRAVWKDAPEPAPASDDSGPAGEPVSGIGVPLVIAAAALAGIVILFLFRRKKK